MKQNALIATLALGLSAAVLAAPLSPPASPSKPAAPPERPARPERPTPPDRTRPATPPPPGTAPEIPGVDAEEMEAWSRYMTPGPEHAWLMNRVGEWDVEVLHFMAPDAPPSKSMATASISPIMGGRYIVEKVRGEMMGMPFEGLATMGFDNAAKEFVWTWIDNLGTGIMHGTAEKSEDGKTFTSVGVGIDPMTGKEVKMRSVETWVDANTKRTEMFGPGPDGQEMKAMEMTYKRRAARPGDTRTAP